MALILFLLRHLLDLSISAAVKVTDLIGTVRVSIHNRPNSRRRRGLTLSGGVVAVLTKATTGRSANTSHEAFSATQRLQSRLQSRARSHILLLLTDSTAWRLWRELRQETVCGLYGTYYRGRRFKRGDEMPRDFGPAPAASAQRYNGSNVRAWYLAKTCETVHSEMRNVGENDEVAVQQFNFEANVVSLIRISNTLIQRSPYLYHFMMACENTEQAGLDDEVHWRAPQFLSRLCRLAGIQALEYPSVRGRYPEHQDAVNLVVFGRAIDGLVGFTTGHQFILRQPD